MCESCTHCQHHEGGEMTAQMNNCGHGHGHCAWNKHRILRIALLLGIVFFTFWMGVKIGEFRGEYGYGHMDRGYGYRSEMMRGGNYYAQPQGRVIIQASQGSQVEPVDQTNI
jgi:hypothetical protein